MDVIYYQREMMENSIEWKAPIAAANGAPALPDFNRQPAIVWEFNAFPEIRGMFWATATDESGRAAPPGLRHFGRGCDLADCCRKNPPTTSVDPWASNLVLTVPKGSDPELVPALHAPAPGNPPHARNLTAFGWLSAWLSGTLRSD